MRGSIDCSSSALNCGTVPVAWSFCNDGSVDTKGRCLCGVIVFEVKLGCVFMVASVAIGCSIIFSGGASIVGLLRSGTRMAVGLNSLCYGPQVHAPIHTTKNDLS